MGVAAVGRALPLKRYSQEVMGVKLQEVWGGRPRVVSPPPALHESVGAETRYLALCVAAERQREGGRP